MLYIDLDKHSSVTIFRTKDMISDSATMIFATTTNNNNSNNKTLINTSTLLHF